MHFAFLEVKECFVGQKTLKIFNFQRILSIQQSLWKEDFQIFNDMLSFLSKTLISETVTASAKCFFVWTIFWNILETDFFGKSFFNVDEN